LTEREIAHGTSLKIGALLMSLAGVAFVGYGVVFLYRNFFGTGFELGVETISGFTRADLAAQHPEMLTYIGHLHVATTAFIIATGIAVTALAWYGVHSGMLWAWVTAVVAPVVALGLVLPLHYTGGFDYDWVTHLAPICLATLVFVVGAMLSLYSIYPTARRA
jgi:hypothetical protein